MGKFNDVWLNGGQRGMRGEFGTNSPGSLRKNLMESGWLKVPEKPVEKIQVKSLEKLPLPVRKKTPMWP